MFKGPAEEAYLQAKADRIADYIVTVFITLFKVTMFVAVMGVAYHFTVKYW